MAGKRIAIMRFSGGGAVLAIDALDQAAGAGELSPETVKTVAGLFPDWMEVKNPLDMSIPVAKDLNHSFPLVMNALLTDAGVDAVMCIYCSYNLPKYDRYDASSYIRDLSAASPGKPVVCWSYGQDIEGFTRTIEAKRSAIVLPGWTMPRGHWPSWPCRAHSSMRRRPLRPGPRPMRRQSDCNRYSA